MEFFQYDLRVLGTQFNDRNMIEGNKFVHQDKICIPGFDVRMSRESGWLQFPGTDNI